MRTIEIDDDVFFYLQGVSDSTKISMPQIVRERVLPQTISRGENGSSPRPGGKSPDMGSQRSPRDAALCDHVQNPGFLANRSVVDQFLSVLSFIYKQNPDKFEILESLEGRRRKYVAKSEQELDNSGTSVNAKKIPYSGFWVVTNNDTNHKKMLLHQALRLLGYGTEAIRVVTESLR